VRVLIADKFPDQALAHLKSFGFSVDYKPALKQDTLPVAMPGVHVLVVRSTKVSAEAIMAGDDLGLIVRAGAGTNTIDRRAASARGVYVSNCPGRNAVAEAELTMGLILALDRRIPDNVAELRAGRWNKKEYSKAAGLLGRTIGIAGLGRIGQEVLARARAFGMMPEAWSRSLGRARAGALDVGYNATLEQMAAKSDAFTVHLPLTPETRGIMGSSVFDALPEGAMFVNTSRAEIVDEAALREAVKRKGIRAGLDVFEGEPEGGEGAVKSDTFALPTVYGTHHIGASTDQAQSAIAEETVRIIRSFRDTGVVPNCVNLATRSPARCQLVVRHYDKVGVLAGVLDVLREADVNVEEMENEIFDGAQAACARIRLDERPPQSVLDALRQRRDQILHLELMDL